MISLAAVILISGIILYGLIDLIWTKFNEMRQLRVRELELERQNKLLALIALEQETGLEPSYSVEGILKEQ